MSEYCVTAMNLERQESFDHGDWDSFRNTFPTILSQATDTHTLLFQPAPTICPVHIAQLNQGNCHIYICESIIRTAVVINTYLPHEIYISTQELYVKLLVSLLTTGRLFYSMIVWNCQKVNSYNSALKPLPRLPNSSKRP